MQITQKRLAALVIGIAAALPGALLADNFTIEGGARNVRKGQSDVIAAQKADQAITEAGNSITAGRFLDSGDENKFGATLPMLNLGYRKDLGNLGLQFGLGFESFAGNYNYAVGNYSRSSGISVLDSVSGEWKQKETNRDVEVGLRIPIIEKTLFLTPRLGNRLSQLTVTGSDAAGTFTGISGAVLLQYTAQPVNMTGSASGTYAGLNLDWTLSDLLDVYAAFTLMPGLTGNVERKTGDNVAVNVTAAGTTSLTPVATGITVPLSWKSGYEMNGNVLDIGLKWKIGERFFIKTGYKKEAMNVSYPGYIYAATIASGSTAQTTIAEPITNALLYGQARPRSWEAISVSFGANVDFGNTK